MRLYSTRLWLAFFLGVSFLSALAVLIGPASPAAASSTCDAGINPIYQYSGWYASNFANEGLQGDIDFSDLSVEDTNNQHALLYLSSFSEADPNAGAGNDWLQVGYGVGAVDATATPTTMVYREESDYSTGSGPVAEFFDYNLANHYFQTYFQGETDSKGRGLYKAWYALGANQHFLGEAWEVDPTQNRFFGQFEGATAALNSDNCPSINWGLLGSTGNIDDVTSNAETELEILNSTPSWVQWAYGHISTTNHLDGNYSLTTQELYYLFEPQGD